MKKTFKLLSIALLGTTFAFTACEKEENMNNPHAVATARQTEMDALLREAYASAHSNNPMTITIASTEADAYQNRCRELFGGSVLIVTQQNEMSNYTDITIIATSSALAKKIWQNAIDTKAIPFSTQDKTEMNQWKNKMESSGYIVVENYDEKTGTYHGVAYTEKEWSKLNQ